MPSVHLAGLARRHGTLAAELLGDARGQGELGRYFGAGLYERELVWFREREWAMTAEDMLWRRSKAGLHLPAAARQEIKTWLGRPLGRRRKAAPAPEASLRAAMS